MAYCLGSPLDRLTQSERTRHTSEYWYLTVLGPEHDQCLADVSRGESCITFTTFRVKAHSKLQCDPRLAVKHFSSYLNAAYNELLRRHPITTAARVRKVVETDVDGFCEAYPYSDNVDNDIRIVSYFLDIGHNLPFYQGDETFDFALVLWRGHNYLQMGFPSQVQDLAVLAAECLYQLSYANLGSTTSSAVTGACEKLHL